MIREIHYSNYFLSTKVVFKGCKIPKRNPDYISIDKKFNDISSKYWYGEDTNGKYVIRQSNHWVNICDFENNKYKQCERIATCLWSLKTNKKNTDFLGNLEYLTSKNAGKAYLSKFITLYGFDK